MFPDSPSKGTKRRSNPAQPIVLLIKQVYGKPVQYLGRNGSTGLHLYRALMCVSMILVMSSSLCKKFEGAIFPFQIESLENGVNDSIHALHVHKANHGPSATPDFYEAALDDVGGS